MKYETYSAYRDGANMTDYKISQELGIPRSTFSGWKYGQYEPKMSKQLLIAELLQIPSELVLEPDESKAERKRLYDDGEDKDSG